MITKEEMRNITADWCEDNEDYAEIAKSRPEWKHQYFVIDDHLYFEYWDKHEFEFTIYDEMSDDIYDAYVLLATALNFHANMINLTKKNLAEFVDYCKMSVERMNKRIA